MAWSTAELARLASTSVRAVRHYHATGLLDLPHRASNGWKHYELTHLVRLCEIVRLRGLGFSIAEIDALGRGASFADALARLDASLNEQIARLTRVRHEVDALASAGIDSPALPAGLAEVGGLAGLGHADRSFLVLMSCLLDRARLEEFVGLLVASRLEPDLAAFDTLPAEADEQTRAALAQVMVEPTMRLRAQHPSLEELAVRGSADPQRTMRVVQRALDEQHNPAQVDVLHRLRALVEQRALVAVDRSGRGHPDREAPAGSGAGSGKALVPGVIPRRRRPA